MSPLSIRKFPDPLLKQPTRHVARVDGSVRRFLEAMVETMRRHPHCVGLAAPQVGSSLRVAVMDASVHPKAGSTHGLLILVNPRLDSPEGSGIQREGCLSVPDFTANVQRFARVHVHALDAEGSPQEYWMEGFEAIVAQHEVDHLEGKLFLDRVANVKTDVFRRRTYL
jgi:peptide deformylase